MAQRNITKMYLYHAFGDLFSFPLPLLQFSLDDIKSLVLPLMLGLSGLRHLPGLSVGNLPG